MMQVRRQNPIHADLARSMPLRFPVQSRSTRGFRPFMQSRSRGAFRLLMQSRSLRVSGLLLPVRMWFPASAASRANAAPVESSFPCECGSRASAPVPESYRHEFSFCASMCAFIRCQEHYHKSGISSTFLVFLLDFWAKSRGVLPKIFLWHQCFGRYFRNKAIFS